MAPKHLQDDEEPVLSVFLLTSYVRESSGHHSRWLQEERLQKPHKPQRTQPIRCARNVCRTSKPEGVQVQPAGTLLTSRASRGPPRSALALSSDGEEQRVCQLLQLQAYRCLIPNATSRLEKDHRAARERERKRREREGDGDGGGTKILPQTSLGTCMCQNRPLGCRGMRCRASASNDGRHCQHDQLRFQTLEP